MRLTNVLSVLCLVSVAWAHGFPPPLPPPPPPPPSPSPCTVIPSEQPNLLGCALYAHVLIMDDRDTSGLISGVGLAELACSSLGLQRTVHNNWGTFTTALTGGAPWHMVIVMNHFTASYPTPAQMDALRNYIAGVGAPPTASPRLIFFSENAPAYRTHGLFTQMGVLPQPTQVPLALCDHLQPGDDQMAGLYDPFAYNPPGFTLMTVAQALPGATSYSRVAGGVGVTDNVIIRDDLKAAFLGVAPGYMSPETSGMQWMQNLITRLILPADAGDLAVDAVIQTPGPGVAIGEVITAEVVVSSSFNYPVTTRVDFFIGPVEDKPTLPTAASVHTAIVNIPAHGTASAVFSSLPPTLSEECWRIHAVVNGDLSLAECDEANNIESGGMCIMNMGAPCAGTMGDCNGDSASNILDALTAARSAAGSGAPVTFCACDIDGDTSITVLDALAIAQAAASLRVLPPAGTGQIVPSVTAYAPEELSGGTLWDIDVCAMNPVNLNFEYRTGASGIWSQASQHRCSRMRQLETAVAPAVAMKYLWDSTLDVPTRPAVADLRVTVTDVVTGRQKVFTHAGVQLN